MASKKSRKVHVTFGYSKRIMSYEKGVEVQALRSLFLSEFSDVLADNISPANVKFQVFDKTFEDYVDLGNDQQLEENAQIKAITVVPKEKQVSYLAIMSGIFIESGLIYDTTDNAWERFNHQTHKEGGRGVGVGVDAIPPQKDF